jgi:hypothetical protein
LNPPVFYFLRSKIHRQVTQLQISIPGPSILGAACSALVYSQVEFRIVLDHLCKNFLNLRCTFISVYNVHYNTNILGHILVYFLLDSGGGKGSSKHLPPAYNRRILNLEVVTLHRRSDTKRAYRLQAFFFKLDLIEFIKQIKNKSRSY